MNCDASKLVRPWRPFTYEEVRAMRTLGNKLRRLRVSRVGVLRDSRRRTQQEVAQAAGLSESSLGSLENGKRRTRVSTLWRLAGALSSLRPSTGSADALFAEFISIPNLSLSPGEPTSPDLALSGAMTFGSAVSQPRSSSPDRA